MFMNGRINVNMAILQIANNRFSTIPIKLQKQLSTEIEK